MTESVPADQPRVTPAERHSGVEAGSVRRGPANPNDIFRLARDRETEQIRALCCSRMTCGWSR